MKSDRKQVQEDGKKNLGQTIEKSSSLSKLCAVLFKCTQNSSSLMRLYKRNAPNIPKAEHTNIRT